MHITNIFAPALFALALTSCSTSQVETSSDSTWTGCSGQSCIAQGACKPGQSSAQFRAQSIPAAALEPGSHAWASVTFDNCSGLAWSTDTFSLHPAPPVDASTWGTSRVKLPASVPDGARVTIPIPLQAPIVSGEVPFVWRIQGDAVGALEERSKPVTISVRYSPDCSRPGPRARFQGWSIPTVVAAGQKFTAKITLANCGSDTWKKDNGYALASMTDKPETWGQAVIPLPMDVPPLAAIALPIELTAPKTQGTYDFAWKLKDGDTLVDEGTPLGHVTALEPYACPDSGPAARFVREQGVPAAINGSSPLETSETFANCGEQAWDATWHLGAVSPSDDGVWSAGRVALPNVVEPGYAITIPIHGRSPSVLASYPYRWSLVQDGVGPIDEPSPTRSINVTCLPVCSDHRCGGDGCGGSCGSCNGGTVCDGAYCLEDNGACGRLQWWNSGLSDSRDKGAWWDTDLYVSGSTPVQLRHAAQLIAWGIYGWGYMPTFIDHDTGQVFRFLHLRPQDLWATDVGRTYPGGFIVGLSGGDTWDTGLPTYSTGAHLCVQTHALYRDVFPEGWDSCH